MNEVSVLINQILGVARRLQNVGFILAVEEDNFIVTDEYSYCSCQWQSLEELEAFLSTRNVRERLITRYNQQHPETSSL